MQCTFANWISLDEEVIPDTQPEDVHFNRDEDLRLLRDPVEDVCDFIYLFQHFTTSCK